jgi:hypothetical protein
MRTLVLVIALGALAACGSKDSNAPKGSSFTEVLPGSASDAMLPYDTVTSAPPLEPRGVGASDAASDGQERREPRRGQPAGAEAEPEPDAT